MFSRGLKTIIIFCLLGSGTATASLHHDRKAALSFTIPFRNARELHGPQLQAEIRELRFADDVQYTSVIYAAQNMPYIVVWTKELHAQVTRELVDALAKQDGADDLAAASSLVGDNAHGQTHLNFDKLAMRGEIAFRPQHGHHQKIVFQLLRNRVSGISYHYDKSADAAGFQALSRSILVNQAEVLQYTQLHGGLQAQILRFLAGFLAVAALVLALSLTTVFAYHRMLKPQRAAEPWTQHSDLPIKEPGSSPNLFAGMREEGGAADGLFPQGTQDSIDISPVSGALQLPEIPVLIR